MNKVGHYLQEHLTGEVMMGIDARKYFSTDASILAIAPSVVVYPRNENDVRKTTRFSWQLAERNRIIPITARGAGTDQTGASLGNGIMLVFPAHMNRILELDSKTGVVTVEPGINYGKLQQTLHTHNRFLPPYPSSIEYSTIGGAIANNASGERSVKYGSTRDFVKKLRVVLANGEVIETKRLGKRELNKKLGLATFEGEIYRSLDALIEESQHVLKKFPLNVTKNSAGYALHEVKRKDGSFDLTPLIVGSQGTLGIVTEATLNTESHNPNTTLVVGLFDDIQLATEVVSELRKYNHPPSTIELVDSTLLDFVQLTNPNYLRGILDPPFQKLVLFVEFDNNSDRVQKRLAKKVTKLLGKFQIPARVETDPLKKEELWKIRHSVSSLISHSDNRTRAIPFIEDTVVPIDKLKDFLTYANTLIDKYQLKSGLWGHAGDGNIYVQPLLDIAQIGDRQKMFRLMDEYFNMVIKLGGSISGDHGEGRLRAPYLKANFGDVWYELFEQVKKIFDPYGILNPGVKIGVSMEQVKPHIRDEYSLEHLYDHLVKS